MIMLIIINDFNVILTLSWIAAFYQAVSQLIGLLLTRYRGLLFVCLPVDLLAFLTSPIDGFRLFNFNERIDDNVEASFFFVFFRFFFFFIFIQWFYDWGTFFLSENFRVDFGMRKCWPENPHFDLFGREKTNFDLQKRKFWQILTYFEQKNQF